MGSVLMNTETKEIIRLLELRIRMLEGCVLRLADHVEYRGTDMEEHFQLDTVEFYDRLFCDDTIMMYDEVSE